METFRDNNSKPSHQKRQPPPTAPKTKFRHVEVDDRYRDNDVDSAQTVKVKELSEQFMRQLSHESRQNKADSDRGSFGVAGVIVLAENEPEEVSSDIIRSELQAKDEPVFESGRTKNLLEHWKHTEQEYNATKTSTSRFSTGAKPSWIEEIEEAKGIKVDSIGGQPVVESAEQKIFSKTKTSKANDRSFEQKSESENKWSANNASSNNWAPSNAQEGIYEYVNDVNCARPLIDASNYEIIRASDTSHTYGDKLNRGNNTHDLKRNSTREASQSAVNQDGSRTKTQSVTFSNNDSSRSVSFVQDSPSRYPASRDNMDLFSEILADEQLQRHGYSDSSLAGKATATKTQSNKTPRLTNSETNPTEERAAVDDSAPLSSEELDSAHNMLMDILKDLDNQSVELQNELSRYETRQKSPNVSTVSESPAWTSDSGRHQHKSDVIQPASRRHDRSETNNQTSNSDWFQDSEQDERNQQDSREKTTSQRQQNADVNKSMQVGYADRRFDLHNNSFRRDAGMNESQERPTTYHLQEEQYSSVTEPATASYPYPSFAENQPTAATLTNPWEKEPTGQEPDSKGKSKKKKKNGNFKKEKKSCSLM